MKGLVRCWVLGAVAVGLAGCGGVEGRLNGGGGNSVPISGGFPEAGGAANGSASSGANPTTVTVEIGGTSTQGVLPPNTTINPGDAVAVIPKGTPILAGLKVIGGRDPGDVYIDGKLAGNLLTGAGTLTENLIFVSGTTHTLRLFGPCEISTGTSVLTIFEVRLSFDVKLDPGSGKALISLPKTIDGRIPANGSSTFNNGDNAGVTATFNSFWNGATAQLRLEKSNGTLAQERTVSGGKVNFRDITSDSSAQIPSNGLDALVFSCTK